MGDNKMKDCTVHALIAGQRLFFPLVFSSFSCQLS